MKIMKFYLSLENNQETVWELSIYHTSSNRIACKIIGGTRRMKLHNFVTADDVLQAIKIFKKYLVNLVMMKIMGY